ncbi:hypothetical protein AB0O67_06770 [Streptomyces sp. NPDC086077]|uniref:hypothetical protein n=1 Tax=Streptomyces sp. NPDC086077 TaxID=3154862 RepID=UPI0034295DD7
MFTPRKLAAISAIVGSLAAISVGAGHAHADGRSGDCDSAAPGDAVCIRKSETHVKKDGEHIIRQEQQCTTVDRPNVVFREYQLLGDKPETAGAGAVVDCSNTAKIPEGSRPHFDF